MKLRAKVLFEFEYTVGDTSNETAETTIALEKQAAEEDILLFLDFCQHAPIIEITVAEEERKTDGNTST
jgi:hypothetical protein